MKKEKILNIFGIILGIIIICVGLYVMFNAANSYSTSYVPYYSFGADFYTEQYAATRAAANNIRAIATELSRYAGLAFIIVGVLTFFSYFKKLLCCSAVPVKTADAVKAFGTVEVAKTDSAAKTDSIAEEIEKYKDLIY